MKNQYLITLFAIFALSCSSEEESLPALNQQDSIIFGEVYGECSGECRKLYLLNDMGIFEDANENEPLGGGGPTIFNPMPLDQDTYNRAKVLLTVPSKILDESFELKKPAYILADFDYVISITKDGKTIKTFSFDKVIEDDSQIQAYFDLFLEINESLK